MSVQQGLPKDGLLLLAGPEPALDLSVVLKQPSGPASEGGPEPLRWEGCGARLPLHGGEGSPWHLVQPRARQALLRLPRSLASSGDSLCGLLWQLRWVRQDGGGGAQMPQGAEHRWKTGRGRCEDADVRDSFEPHNGRHAWPHTHSHRDGSSACRAGGALSSPLGQTAGGPLCRDLGTHTSLPLRQLPKPYLPADGQQSQDLPAHPLVLPCL